MSDAFLSLIGLIHRLNQSDRRHSEENKRHDDAQYNKKTDDFHVDTLCCGFTWTTLRLFMS